MYQKINLIVIIVLCSFVGYTQNLNDHLKEIVSKMDSSKSVSLEIDVKMYSKKGSSLVYSSNAAVYKSGVKTKNVLSEMEYVDLGKHTVRIDHEEKAVLIQEKQSISPEQLASMRDQIDVKELQKLLKKQSSGSNSIVKLKSSTAGIRIYSITGVSEMKEVIIELDIDKSSIRKISYEYGDSKEPGQYIVLDYTKFDFDHDLSSEFEMTKYFTIENNIYKLSPALAGYILYTEE
jgi:hypothetical protein